MNTLLNSMKTSANFGITENGAVKHFTTNSAVLDMFGMCGAYRKRSNEDCILAFKNALEENTEIALKCLFYLRDCRGGQGERRFFRVCFNWLAKEHPEYALKNFEYVPEYGRYDDLMCLFDTPLEDHVMHFIKMQLALDLDCNTPSLLAKWLPSENASSADTKANANKIRKYLEMSHKQYRKILSTLRAKIKIVETLMSQNRWDEIEFDKIPSQAGLKYKNAFARRDIIAKKYEQFAKDKTTTVNAATLTPVEIANQIFGGRNYWNKNTITETDRNMLQKYWDALPDYYDGREENGLCVVDVSGSMWGTPLNAAVSMGAYIAERGHGPFANHFITFSEHPELVKFEGVDIVDKFQRAERADWGMSTNLEAVFDMLLTHIMADNVKTSDIPERLYIFSDMEFNNCLRGHKDNETLLEGIAKEWAKYGYELPKVIFWNLDARSQNVPALGKRFSYVSGFSMSMVEAILSGKDGHDLMLEKLLSDRYNNITA